MEELAKVRAQGFAIIDQELELGLCSLAIGLEDSRGRVVAAINIGAPAASVPAAELAERYLGELQTVASALRPILR
jgi:IclR family pca regulon transcriptional regulator